jgi:hypothetical protein
VSQNIYWNGTYWGMQWISWNGSFLIAVPFPEAQKQWASQKQEGGGIPTGQPRGLMWLPLPVLAVPAQCLIAPWELLEINRSGLSGMSKHYWNEVQVRPRSNLLRSAGRVTNESRLVFWRWNTSQNVRSQRTISDEFHSGIWVTWSGRFQRTYCLHFQTCGGPRSSFLAY